MCVEGGCISSPYLTAAATAAWQARRLKHGTAQEWCPYLGWQAETPEDRRSEGEEGRKQRDDEHLTRDCLRRPFPPDGGGGLSVVPSVSGRVVVASGHRCECSRLGGVDGESGVAWPLPTWVGAAAVGVLVGVVEESGDVVDGAAGCFAAQAVVEVHGGRECRVVDLLETTAISVPASMAWVAVRWRSGGAGRAKRSSGRRPCGSGRGIG